MNKLIKEIRNYWKAYFESTVVNPSQQLKRSAVSASAHMVNKPLSSANSVDDRSSAQGYFIEVVKKQAVSPEQPTKNYLHLVAPNHRNFLH